MIASSGTFHFRVGVIAGKENQILAEFNVRVRPLRCPKVYYWMKFTSGSDHFRRTENLGSCDFC